MDEDYKELQTLLRLKKYERPPQGFEQYTSRLLKEFHRRQRWENAPAPSFSERVSTWLNALTVPRYAYAATIGVFALVAVVITHTQSPNSTPQIASASLPVAPTLATSSGLALNAPLDLSDLDIRAQMNIQSAHAQSDLQPRYILEARPASFDSSFSF